MNILWRLSNDVYKVWYIGPIGQHTGDIGFEVAFVVSGIFYMPLRSLEIRLRGKI